MQKLNRGGLVELERQAIGVGEEREPPVSKLIDSDWLYSNAGLRKVCHRCIKVGNGKRQVAQPESLRSRWSWGRMRKCKKLDLDRP